MKQTIIILIIAFGLNSCSSKQRNSEQRFPKVQLGENIDIRDFDEQTGWTRTLLKEPHCWGFIDKDSVVKIPFVFKYINPFDSLNMTYGQIGEKYGVIDVDYDTIIPFVYDELRGFKHGLARAVLNNKHGFINRKGETIIPFEFDDAHSFIDCGIAKVRKETKWGFINTKGETVIPFEYEKAEYNNVDSLILITSNGKIAFFDNRGNQLTDFEFDKVYEGRHTDYSHGYTYMNNGLILVEKNNKKSFINSKMVEIVGSDIYDNMYPFEWPRKAIVQKENKFGLIDEFGKLVLKPIYSSIELFPNGGNRYKVQKNQLYGIIDNDLSSIIEVNYKNISANYYQYLPEKNGVLIIQNKSNIFGVTDFNGNIIIPFSYQSISKFEKHSNVVSSIVKKGNEYGIIDINNNTILPIVYDDIIEQSWFDYYIIELDEKFGVIKKNGKSLLPIDFESLEPCHYNKNERFIVSKNGKFGVVNDKNEIIIPLEYEEISNWVEYGPKEHFVVKNGKQGLISREGKIVIPPVYDKLFVDNGMLIKVQNKGFYGTINWKNEIIHPIEYENILWEWPFLSGKPIDTIYIKKSGKYFATDTKGVVIEESVPEELINDRFGYLLRHNEELIIIDE